MLCGSYVVLYGGESAVVTTSARLYVSVSLQPRTQLQRDLPQLPLTSASAPSILVHSPQFQTVYLFSLFPPSNETHLRVEGPTNVYIATALRYILMWQLVSSVDAYIALLKHMEQSGEVLYIRIDGDNDFYSQREHLKARRLPLTPTGLRSLPRFLPAATSEKMKKTGLGSSAALVAALVGALAEFLGLTALHDKRNDHDDNNQSSARKDLNLVHSVAQLVHCVAQGKIGSGFDVSAAVFGSQIYRQFSKEMLRTFIDLPLSTQRTQFIALLEGLMRSTASNHTPFVLPPGIELALGDVDVGADTVSMVTQVQLWAHDAPEHSARLFAELQSNNQNFVLALRELCQLHDGDRQRYQQQLATAAEQTYDEWQQQRSQSPVCAVLCQTREVFQQIRRLLRELGTLAKVPIEPPSQTTLLDRTITLPGVVCAGVPGAGGYDAVFALCITASLDRLHNLWTEWSEMSVCPLLARADNRGLEISTYFAHLSLQ
jgi:phosphomevalonate kinase